MRYLGARPQPTDNIPNAMKLFDVIQSTDYGLEDDRSMMIPSKLMYAKLKQLDKASFDFTQPIDGKPAAHAWVSAAVEAEGLADGDSSAKNKVTRLLLTVARAGVDFSQADENGNTAMDAAKIAMTGLDQPTEGIDKRTAFYEKTIARAAAEKTISREERVQAAATRKAAAKPAKRVPRKTQSSRRKATSHQVQ